jgi:hypothetical protein
VTCGFPTRKRPHQLLIDFHVVNDIGPIYHETGSPSQVINTVQMISKALESVTPYLKMLVIWMGPPGDPKCLAGCRGTLASKTFWIETGENQSSEWAE